MDHLIDEFNRRHQEIARHSVGSIVLDEQEPTEDQLQARVREFCARAACQASRGVAHAPPPQITERLRRAGPWGCDRAVDKNPVPGVLGRSACHGRVHRSAAKRAEAPAEHVAGG